MQKIIIKIGILIMISLLFVGCAENTNNQDNYNISEIDNEVKGANKEFAFDIFKVLNEEEIGNNVFISPISISSALSMTYNGSEGITKEEMAKVLGFSEIEDKKINQSYDNLLDYMNDLDEEVKVNIANSIWIRKDEKIGEEFITENQKYFNAEVEEIDFSKSDAADKINNWIAEKTDNKIEKMLEPPISSDVVMYLINAIYFSGAWSEEFDKEKTFETNFFAEEGNERKIDMMHKKSTAYYGDTKEYKTLRLPFGDDIASMYFILPNEEVNINTFVSNMNVDKWNEIKNSISETEDVQIFIPRFKLEYGIKKLNESLRKLGMNEAFSSSANFSKIREGIFINRVLHKAVIEVNEEGSEAAAATVVEMTESAALEEIIFKLNRPFVFMIEDNETGTILFIGKTSDIVE